MPTTTEHASAIRAKRVMGTTVTDPEGKKIGEVEDLVLDKQSNSILFAKVGFGGFLGMAEKRLVEDAVVRPGLRSASRLLRPRGLHGGAAQGSAGRLNR